MVISESPIWRRAVLLIATWCALQPNHLESQILSHDTYVQITKEHKKITSTHVQIQINNRHDTHLAKVQVGHGPLQEFSFDFAHIIDRLGKVVSKFKKKDLITRNDLSYQAFYQDNLITEFELYWNDFPYQIEYAYTIEESEFLFVEQWSPYIFTNVPTKSARLQVTTPADYEIHVSNGGNFNHQKLVERDLTTYVWQGQAEPIATEQYAQPIAECVPRLRIVPRKFTYSLAGSTESWATFGTWFSTLNQDMDILPATEKAIVEDLLNGIDQEDEVVRKLYHYLQESTRYINVALDYGGLKSYSAGYVARNKYGDCKALTTYMKALLNAAGIPSYYTIINAGTNARRIATDFPSQQFNHVILAVPVNGDTLWLENTSNTAPFGYLGTFTQDRYGLLIDSANSSLVKTPALSSSDVLAERNFSYNLTQAGQWQGEINIKLRGSGFEQIRAHVNTHEPSATFDPSILGLTELATTEFRVVNFNRDHSYLELHSSGIITPPAEQLGSWLVIRPLNIEIPEFENPQKRQLDIRLPYPYRTSDKITFNTNNIKPNAIQIPEDFEAHGRYGDYSAKYILDNGSIAILEHFSLNSGDVPLSEYQEFHDFLSNIVEYKKEAKILIR